MPATNELSRAEIEQATRTQLGHDLHDGPLQLVVGAKMLAESFASRVERGQLLSVSELERLAHLLAQAIAETRQLVLETRPVSETEPWTESLNHWLALQPAGGAIVNLQWTPSVNLVPLSLGETLYRIAREAIQNALRHAVASRIKVTAESKGNGIEIIIDDNGIGFDPKNLPAGHFGVKGLQERATGAGGRCEIRSSPGQGTTVTVVLPLV